MPYGQDMNAQRNAITQALMGIRNPPPGGMGGGMPMRGGMPAPPMGAPPPMGGGMPPPAQGAPPPMGGGQMPFPNAPTNPFAMMRGQPTNPFGQTAGQPMPQRPMPQY